ncbi:MAG: hypothetical protein J6C96_02015 [Oscillospiraceae bacterium]|nr:hypothetical protein [Oscillospiraceae bacterium]
MNKYFDERYQKHKKSLSLFYMGVFMGAMALIMAVVSINGIIGGEDVLLIGTGFAAAILWLAVSVVNFYLYYLANRETMNNMDFKEMSK